ncbi:DUF4012 domain-containing protein [Agromyces aerolatus]|uniref:DUF4012 domain-containing protein n=1 Tax=Agromyces sp. LY-1074 TaxID=3074080 RepID=UPI00285F9C70|nr:MULTISPECIES: DUF4012 domain-containing protein [unclassified Agromyces]MDR5701484.1 DUF4012 domain-containing protein [Agromyces sp. LY-1074]MDR5704449.1 DUF4012 domain-containing protein [Agromyces sp. LY-1358]
MTVSPNARGRSRRIAKPASVRRWWIWGSVSVVLALVIGFAAWIGVRGLQAKEELEAAIPLARTTQQAIIDGDTHTATRMASELAEGASRAASLTGDPVWRAAEVLPWAGPNLHAMRVIAASVEHVALGAVTPLARAADQLDLAAFRPQGGRIDLAPLVALQDPVRDAVDAISDAQSVLHESKTADGELIGPLAEAREQLSAMLDETSGVVDALDRAVQLVPMMLGQNGGRDILLLFQNNAELRSTGGIPGALAMLHTDGGSFQLTQQANSSDFPRFDPPVVELPPETRALWGENTARYVQDVTFTPQFPIGASVAREMWANQFGSAPASVVAIDPVVLSYLLRATGPIDLPTGDQLTADNAVQLLLEDVYERYEDPAEQDLFFAAAAAAVLNAVSSGSAEPRALIDALIEAGSERRILIWNADPAEQDILAGTTLAGELPASQDGEQAFGVYLNDMTMSKMDSYLDVQIASGVEVCRTDGLPQYEVEVTLTNTAPGDAATSLPAYVLGGGGQYEPGVIATSVHVYSAPGTFNLGVRQGGEPAAYHPSSDSGYTLSKVTATLAPGESTSWRFSFLGDAAEKRTPVIQSTPMIYKNEVSGLAVSCDSSVS